MKNMMIGNAHLDPVWLWQWQEGLQEVKATFRSALDRLNENPDFVFTCACAAYYSWVEENDPDMFEEIRERVRQGRWVIVGGMWIQPDMNTPSGESFARQLLLSQRYFYEKFGVTAHTGYNVDSFGHNAMIPQILLRAGIRNYVWMRPSKYENPDIPEGSMIWEAPEGSQVHCFRIPVDFSGYSCWDHVPGKVDEMFALSDSLAQPVMCFYGVGNHGGGPTIRNLEEIDALRVSHERKEEIVYASPEDFFAELKKSGIPLPIWRNELQHHASGCYSTHSLSKLRHRQAENALLRMEKLGVLSSILTGHKGRPAFVRQAWENLLFNEFHDIMGGCSLPEAMEDVIIQLDETLSIAAREENAALQKISWRVDTSKGQPPVRSKKHFSLWGNESQGTPVVVFNPHGWEVTGTVLIRQPLAAVYDDDGQRIPSQSIRASRTNGADDRLDGIFRAQVPPLGYRLYWIFPEGDSQVESPLRATRTCLENTFLRAEFSENGELLQVIRKDSGTHVLRAPASTRLYDISASDTWAHNVFRFDQQDGAFTAQQAKVVESGPVRAVLRVDSFHDESRMTQWYTLYADSDQLDLKVELDLREKHRMIKFCLPTIFEGESEVSEIAYGALTRTACGNEEHCQRWVALGNEADGLAVLNNGKYSYSAQEGELRLTLANTSIFADHYGQAFRDDACRFMDQGEQHFELSLCPYAGNWRSAGLDRRAALLNQPLSWVVETYHTGPLPAQYQGVTLSDPAVTLSALKRAEDDAGYVLRLHETTGLARSLRVDLPLWKRQLDLTLAPYEIRSLYLPDDAASPIREVLLTEYDR